MLSTVLHQTSVLFYENPERMTKLLKIKNDISLVSIVPHFLVILDNNPTYETLNPLDLSLKNLQNYSVIMVKNINIF